MDCQEMEMRQLVALAQRRENALAKQMTLRRTATEPLDPLGLRWNSNIRAAKYGIEPYSGILTMCNEVEDKSTGTCMMKVTNS